MNKTCHILGAEIETGASQPGCIMGPAALRTAGLVKMIDELGWNCRDLGNVQIPRQSPLTHDNPAIHHLAETRAWIEALVPSACAVADDCNLPIFLGGDHSISAGTVAAMAHRAENADKPLYLLWLDAHPDLHTLHSTTSGNLHGTPVAYVTGQTGFDAYPSLTARVKPENICMMGIRSVDPAEHDIILSQGIEVHDMRTIDEHGVAKPLQAFLDRVKAAGGHLHVSFDVDFLDPSIAPAVGTTVPGGATFREAHLIMEMLCDSDLVTSLDLVELNPFLDERGRTASLLVDLTASLMGRRVLDRMTRSFAA